MRRTARLAAAPNPATTTAPSPARHGCGDRSASRLWTLAEIETVARRAHAGHTDRTGQPYAEHIAAVAEGVRARGGTAEQIAAGWLHDTVEHHRRPPEWLRSAPLPQSVKDMVTALTRGEDEDLESYVGRIHETPGARLVKEADLASNTDPERLAALDAPTRDRLTEKYTRTRTLLGRSR